MLLSKSLKCQIKLLKQETYNKKRNLRSLRRDLTSVKNELYLKLTFIDLNVCKLFLIGHDKAVLNHKQIQNKKLNNIKVTTLENSTHNPGQVIYNFSDYELTECGKSVVCKGLEFAIPFNKLEYADFMMRFELLFCVIKNSNNLFLKLKSLNQKF